MSARNRLTTGIAVVALACLGAAGYFANKWRVCSSLENDYISLIEDYTSNQKTRVLLGAVGVRDQSDHKDRKQLEDLALELQMSALNRIYDRCGMKAGRAASARSQEILQEGMQDILSVP